MHVRLSLGSVLLAACVPLLAGCGGGAAPAALSPASRVLADARGHRSTILNGGARRHGRPLRVRSWIKAGLSPTNPLLYVSDPYGDFVNIYSQNGSGQSPVGQLTGFNEPQSMWVNVNQNLWVVNTLDTDVLAYHRGATSSYKTLTDPSGYPAGICGNNNRNLVYVTDITSASYGNGQTINVYDKRGASSPIQVLTDPNSESLSTCAVDSHGNLFVTLYNLLGYGEVDEFPKNVTTPTVLISNLIEPIGITVNQYNALAVNDVNGYPYDSTIYLYDPPYTAGSFYSFGVSGLILQTALTHNRTALWGANSNGLTGTEWSYPHGLFQGATSTQDLIYPDGIAVSPAAAQ